MTGAKPPVSPPPAKPDPAALADAWLTSAGGPDVRDSFDVFFSYSTVDHAAVERVTQSP